MPQDPGTPRSRPLGLIGALILPVLAGACASVAAAGPLPLRIGAIFPLAGTDAPDSTDEYLGVQLAAQMVNTAGGVGGRSISLDLRDVEDQTQLPAAIASLHADGVPAVIGAYSSQLSIPAAAAVAAEGMVYWETGAVADRVTGAGSPLVFRVGVDGAELGSNSGQFVTSQLVPKLGPVSKIRVYFVTADDEYGHSVADATRSALHAGGLSISGESVYNPYTPNWAPVMQALASAKPDILVLSSHIQDGIAFRRAFLAAGLSVKVFMGTTMAQCDQDFGNVLGSGAVGVFASDRPQANFNPDALDPQARALYNRFAALWRQRTGEVPSEEGLAGFSAAWVLFADVLGRGVSDEAPSIAAAARALDLPEGSLANGAGVRFSTAAGQLGQNIRAAAVVWQWQAPRVSVVVWPPVYATGQVKLALHAS
ncbi:MAG TPA: ABC transporter substrate-binding protein [Candidatus Saccharimonadales bacterium]|nr:ABC transporter substrate-binding protein [Candidatus Saccharimonadales bacterium]